MIAFARIYDLHIHEYDVHQCINHLLRQYGSFLSFGDLRAALSDQNLPMATDMEVTIIKSENLTPQRCTNMAQEFRLEKLPKDFVFYCIYF